MTRQIDSPDTTSQGHLDAWRQRPRATISDWTLTAGLVGAFLLGVMALYGPLLAPHDPWEPHPLLDGSAPPFAPNPFFPLGADELGRDRLSWLLYGARTTLVLVLLAATLRSFVGVSLGVFSAWRGGLPDRILSRLSIGLASMPAVIGALVGVLTFGARDLASFVFGLALVGWCDPFLQSRRAALAEAAKPYMTCARSIGLTDRRLVIRHLIPNVAAHVVTAVAYQLSAVLQLLGELGLIHVFFGGLISTSVAILPAQPEWASTLSGTRPIFDLYGNAIAVVAPGFLLLISVLTFNLLGDALARRAQQLDIFRLFSRRQTLIAIVCTGLLVAPALAWSGPLASDLAYAGSFNVARAEAVALVLSSPGFGDRAIGSTGANAAAQVLATAMSGEVRPFATTAVATRDIEIRSGGRGVRREDAIPLTRASTSIEGTAAFVNAGPAFLFMEKSDQLKARVAFVSGIQVPSLAQGVAQQLARLGAVGMVIVADDSRFAIGDYPLPSVRITPRALDDLFGDSRLWPPPDQPVRNSTATVTLTMTFDTTAVTASSVIAAAKSDGESSCSVLVAVTYDAGVPGATPSQRAAAAGVVAAALDAVRARPLACSFIFTAIAGNPTTTEGLRAALDGLSPALVASLRAVVYVDAASELQMAYLFGGKTNYSGTAAASRVAAAVDARATAGLAPEFASGVKALGLHAPTFVLTVQGIVGESSRLSRSGRALLTLLAYLAARDIPHG